MIDKKNDKTLIYGLISVLAWILYIPLSWILLLRDQTLIHGLGEIYPRLLPGLLAWRENLLHLGLNTIATLVFIALMFVIAWSYFQMLKRENNIKKILIFPIVFLFVTLFSFPVLSTDIFDYVLTNEQVAVCRTNIWALPPSSCPTGPLILMTSWSNITSPYGIVNQFFYNFSGIIGGKDLLLSVVANKLLVTFFGIGVIIVLYKFFKEYSPNNLTRGLILFAWNPLFIIETAGNGHNDIIMVFFVLLAIYFWKKSPILSGFFLAVSIQTKFMSVFLLPFVVLYMVLKRQFKQLFEFLTSFGLFLFLSIWIMGEGFVPYLHRLIFGSSIYWQSFPSLFQHFFPNIKGLFLGLLVTLLIVQLIRLIRHKDSPLSLYCQTIFIYLILLISAFWNWYPIWILGLAPLLGKKWQNAIVVLSISSVFLYPLRWIMLRLNKQEDILFQSVIYLCLIAPAIWALFNEKDNSQALV